MTASYSSKSPATAAPEVSPSAGFPRRSTLILRAGFQLLLAASAFVFNVTLERRFDGLGAFDQLDVIFDADPNTRLGEFGSGAWRHRCFVHPLLRLVSLPIRGATTFADVAGITVAPPKASRRSLALLVAPVCSALTAVVMFRVFLGAGFGDLAAATGAILHQMTFSQMMFGSIPDHFVLGGLGLSLVLLCGLVPPTSDRVGWLRWLAVGVFTSGVTITQIIPTCIMFASCCRCCGREVKETAKATALLGGLSVALALSISSLLTFPIVGSSQLTPAAQAAGYAKFFPSRPLSHAFDVIAALPNSIAPPPARVVPDRRGDSNRSQIRFTLESVRHPGRIAAGWMLLLVGAWLGLRSDAPAVRALCLGSIAVVLYNIIFHALWGKEWFLYSQHWLAPMVFLMAAPLRDAGRYRLPVWGAAAIALTLIASSNWFRIGEIVARLEAEPKSVVTTTQASEIRFEGGSPPPAALRGMENGASH